MAVDPLKSFCGPLGSMDPRLGTTGLEVSVSLALA